MKLVIASLLSLATTMGHANTQEAATSHQEAISAIQFIGSDIYYNKLIQYSSQQQYSELFSIKLAINERKQYLEAWRDDYYRNYSLFWLTVHLGVNFWTGVPISVILFLGDFIRGRDKNLAIAGCTGVAFTALFMAKNIVGYTYGWMSDLAYEIKNVDLQISRLTNLLNTLPS